MLRADAKREFSTLHTGHLQEIKKSVMSSNDSQNQTVKFYQETSEAN